MLAHVSHCEPLEQSWATELNEGLLLVSWLRLLLTNEVLRTGCGDLQKSDKWTLITTYLYNSFRQQSFGGNWPMLRNVDQCIPRNIVLWLYDHPRSVYFWALHFSFCVMKIVSLTPHERPHYLWALISLFICLWFISSWIFLDLVGREVRGKH